jgi:hypothetical protein
MVKAYNLATHIETYADWAISFSKKVKKIKSSKS